jgi:hypothetical protein
MFDASCIAVLLESKIIARGGPLQRRRITRRKAGCAAPTSSTGHAPAGTNPRPKLTFRLDHQAGAGHYQTLTNHIQYDLETIGERRPCPETELLGSERRVPDRDADIGVPRARMADHQCSSAQLGEDLRQFAHRGANARADIETGAEVLAFSIA